AVRAGARHRRAGPGAGPRAPGPPAHGQVPGNLPADPGLHPPGRRAARTSAAPPAADISPRRDPDMVTPMRTLIRRFQRGMAAIIAALGIVLLPALPAQAGQYVNINGEGSSWAGVAWHQWEVNAAADGTTFNYTPNGSSAGRDDFAQQQSAMFADS